MDEQKTYSNSSFVNLSIKEMVLKIIEEFHEFSNGQKAPKQNDIVKRLSEIKKDLANSDDYKYEFIVLQPQVSRALKQLDDDNKIVKTESSTYRPYDIKFKRKPLADKIKKEVIFRSPNIFKLSPYAILVPVDPRSLYTAKFLFKDYLKEDCTDVLEVDGYILILLSQKYSDDMNFEGQSSSTINQLMDEEQTANLKIRKEIRKLVEDCFNEQQRKAKK